MYQHPVPQNVTGYQFRLIGDMTIKQFLLLGAGIIVSILFYFTNLFSPIKWLFIISSGLFGAALAFLPIEERPLDQWIVAFLKSVYAPTSFIWQKNPKEPSFFSFIASKILPNDSAEIAQMAALRKKQGILTYLQTLPQGEILSQLEEAENSQVEGLLSLFSQDYSPPKPVSGALNISAPIEAPIIAPVVKKAIPAKEQAAPSSVAVVENIPVKIARQTTNPTGARSTIDDLKSNNSPPMPSSSTIAHKTLAPTQTVATSTKLPFPTKPSQPNIIVGMVLDRNQKIIDGAIIEIRDKQGLPVRATKTNKLGQFFSTTPLPSGSYEIEVEKENFTFDILKLDLLGKIVDPLKIQAS